jgi:hypothetical protein
LFGGRIGGTGAPGGGLAISEETDSPASGANNPADERQVQVSLTDKGRALRAETKTLAEALYGKSRMSVAEVADLNVRVTALRDAFKAAEPVASRVGPT